MVDGGINANDELRSVVSSVLRRVVGYLGGLAAVSSGHHASMLRECLRPASVLIRFRFQKIRSRSL